MVKTRSSTMREPINDRAIREDARSSNTPNALHHRNPYSKVEITRKKYIGRASQAFHPIYPTHGSNLILCVPISLADRVSSGNGRAGKGRQASKMMKKIL